MDALIVLVASLGFAALLLAAAIHKAVDLVRFRALLADYRVLPTVSVSLVAVVVVAVEGLLGVGWLFQVAIGPTAIATAVLLAIYTAAIAVNLLRGRGHISCGCGGADEQPLSSALLLRNGLLICAAMLLTIPANGRPLGIADMLVAAIALPALMFCYLAASRLMANGAAMASWRTRHG